jgi:hypothetical protein
MKTPSSANAPFLRHLLTLTLCLVAAAIVWFPSAAAYALIPVRLFDLSYEVCPDELGRGAVDAGSNTKSKKYRYKCTKCFLCSERSTRNICS